MSTLWLLLFIDRTRNRHCFAFSPYLHFSSLQTSCMKCFYYRARSFLSGSFTALAMTLQAWKYKHFFNYFSCAILLKAEIHDMHLSWFKSHVYWYLITLTIDMSATPHMPHGQKSVKLTPCAHCFVLNLNCTQRWLKPRQKVQCKVWKLDYFAYVCNLSANSFCVSDWLSSVFKHVRLLDWLLFVRSQK